MLFFNPVKPSVVKPIFTPYDSFSTTLTFHSDSCLGYSQVQFQTQTSTQYGKQLGFKQQFLHSIIINPSVIDN